MNDPLPLDKKHFFSSHSQAFSRVDILKSFAKFTGNLLGWSPFLLKLLAELFQFSEKLFHRASVNSVKLFLIQALLFLKTLF